MAKVYYRKPKFKVKTYGDYLKEAALKEPELYKSAIKRYRKWSDACLPPCYRDKEKTDDELFRLWISQKKLKKARKNEDF